PPMFEQSSIDSRGILKSPWAMTASVAGQTFALGVGILVSLTHTDALPRGASITTIAAPGGPLKSAAPVSGTVLRSRTAHRPFLLAAKNTNFIDSKSQKAAISLSPDDTEIGSGQSTEPGLFSIGGPGIPGGVIIRVPPPPPTLVERPSEKPATLATVK